MSPPDRPAPDRGETRRLSPLSRNFGALLGMQVIGRAIRFAYLAIIAALLPPDQVGIYLYGASCYLVLLVIAGFGQDIFLGARLGRRPELVRAVLPRTLGQRLVTIAGAVLLGAIYIWAVERDPVVVQAVAIFVGAVATRSLLLWMREAATALERSAWIPRYELLFRGAETLIGTALLAAGGTVLSICYLHALIWVAEAAMAGALLRAQFGVSLRPVFSRVFLRKAMPICAAFALCVGSYILAPEVGVITLKQLAGEPATAGQYAVAIQFFTAALVIPAALGSALVPALGRARRNGAVVEIRALSLLVKIGFVGGGILAVFASAYAPPFIAWFLGDEYRTAGAVFGVLAWAIGPYSVAMVAGQALNSMGRRLSAAAVATTIVVLQPVIAVAIVAQGALWAVATGLLTAAIGGCALGIGPLGRLTGTTGHGWWLRAAGVYCGAAAFTWLEPISLLWAAPALVVVIIVASWAGGVFGKAEMHFFAARLGMRLSRTIAARSDEPTTAIRG